MLNLKRTLFNSQYIIIFLGFVVANAMAQPTFNQVFSPNEMGPGSSSRLTYLINNASANPITDLSFTNTLPAAITLSNPVNVFSDCIFDTGGVSAPDGGSVISITDGKLGAGAICTIEVNVTSATVGTHTNTSGDLTSSAGNSGNSTDDLVILTTRPGFTKSFAPSSVSLGSKSTLTFTIDNSLNAASVGNLDFTDILPVGMEIASPANAFTNCISAGLQDSIVTAVPGSNLIKLDANGLNFGGFEVLASGATCSVSVDVIATGVGMLNNQSRPLLAGFTDAGFAVATLEATATRLAFSKEFKDDPVPPGSNVTLEFNIQNFDRNFPATGVEFTDNLATVLAGLTFDSLIANDCGGSVSGVGGTTVSFSGGTLAAQGSCTISVSLSVPASATPGAYANTTNVISATVNGAVVSGNQARDDLFVEPVPMITKEFLTTGTLVPDPVVNPGDDVVLRFTVTNTSTTSSATDITFVDELTDGGPGTGFFPFPISIVSPSIPVSVCGGNLSFVFPDPERQALSLTGGSLSPAGMAGDSCTFDVTITVPTDMPLGVYTNTTGNISATVDGATRIGGTASDTLSVIAAPSLSLSFFDDPVAPGATVRMDYELTYSGNANANANGILFNHNLSTTLAGLVATGLPITNACDPDGPGGDDGTGTLSGFSGDTLLEIQGANLAPGESCIISVDLLVPAGVIPGSYPSTTSTVSAVIGAVPATSAAASDELKVAGLNFTKEFINNPVIAGDTTTLRFTIENIHPTDDATISLFTDNLAANLAGLTATGPASLDTCGGALSGTTFLIYVGGSVLSGQSCTIEVGVLVPAAAADGAYVNITSALSADQGGAVTIDPAIGTLEVSSTLIELSKQFIDDPVAPGGTATLEFTVTNLSATNAISSIAFTDDLDAVLSGMIATGLPQNDVCGSGSTLSGTGVITLSDAQLAPSASCTFSVSVNVPNTAAAGVYTNTTSAVSGMASGFPVTGAMASDELSITNVLGFTKSFDGPTTATGTANLTFTITNPSATITANNLNFSDDLNAVIPGLIATDLPSMPCGQGSSITGITNLTFTGGNLAINDSCSFVVEVTVPNSATAGTFLNTTSDLTDNGLLVSSAPATANLVIEPPPTFAKVFTPSSVGVGQSSTLMFSIDNSLSSLAANNLGFTDNLPGGMVVATPANASTTCTGGTLTAASGSGVISYTGGSVAAAATCIVQVEIQANAVGGLVNTSNDLTSSSGSSGTATDTLTVNPQPIFSKSFGTNPSIIDDVNTLTFTIDNSSSTVSATALDFTDNLPAGMLVAATPNASTNCTGGTLTAAANSSSINYTGGSVANGATCSVSVDITASASGDLANLTGDLTSSLGNSGTATDTLTVEPPLEFSKIFGSPVIFQGNGTGLFFTINNLSATTATNIEFTDNLPAGMVVANPSSLQLGCQGGTVTAIPGSSVISYSGGSAPTGSCGINVRVTSSVLGTHVNTTDDLTSSLGNSGSATATLQVIEPPVFTKSFDRNTDVINNPNTLTFTVDNSANTVDVPVGFIDTMPTGLIVANPSNASTTCGGTLLTATPGTNVINYSGDILEYGEVAAGSTCTVSVDIVATMPGTFVNASSVLSGGVFGDGTTPATDT
ncbi:MAG: hypothetical protein AB8B80_14615, partial [Marinicellaceae bacterium]